MTDLDRDPFRARAPGDDLGDDPAAHFLGRSVARLSRGRSLAGMGLYVGDQLLVTCAHVVNVALGRDEDAADPPVEPVTVDFPLVRPPFRTTARVAAWHPPSDSAAGDIAGLVLADPVPARVQPTMISRVVDPDRHPFLTFGYRHADWLGAGVWIAGEIRGRVAEDWLQLAVGDRDDGLWIQRGFSGSPVYDQHSGRVVGLVSAVYDDDVRAGYAVPGDAVIDGWADLAARADTENPFRLLRPFDTADSRYFFGRDELTARVVTRLSHDRVVVVTGASGAGKSSLLNAGVAARLGSHPGVLPVGVRLESAGSPWLALATALHAALGPPSGLPAVVLADTLASWAAALRAAKPEDVVVPLLRGRRPGRLVLLVDEFEAVFGAGDEEAAEVLATLVRLAEAEPPRAGGAPWVRVVLSIRSDALARLGGLPGAASLVAAAVEVPPLSEAQLRATVQEPVRVSGLARYEPGLVDRIVEDLRDQPHSLPLLQAVLAELWERRTGHGVLTQEAYQRIRAGGGPLARRVDNAWATLLPAQREEARRLVLHLAAPLPNGVLARRVARRAEVDPQSWPVAGLLATTRVLVVGGRPGGDDTVEFAHEALIESAPLLSDWLHAHEDLLRWRGEIRRRVDAWERSDRDLTHVLDPDEVPPARRVHQAHAALLSRREIDFLAASERFRRWFLRLATAAATGAVLLLITALVAGTAFLVDRRADTATANASQAVGLATGPAPDARQAAYRAAAAARLADVPAGRDALASAYEAFRRVRGSHVEPGADDVATSADGTRRVVYGGERVTVRDLSGLVDGGRVSTAVLEVTATVVGVGPDGARVAVVDPVGEVSVWDSARGLLVSRFTAAAGPAGVGTRPLIGLAVDRLGTVVAALTEDRLALLDARTGRLLAAPAPLPVGSLPAQDVDVHLVGDGRGVLVRAGRPGSALTSAPVRLYLVRFPPGRAPLVRRPAVDPRAAWLDPAGARLLSCRRDPRNNALFHYDATDLVGGRVRPLLRAVPGSACGTPFVDAEAGEVMLALPTPGRPGGHAEVWRSGTVTTRFPLPVGRLTELRPRLHLRHTDAGPTLRVGTAGQDYALRLPPRDSLDFALGGMDQLTSNAAYDPTGRGAAVLSAAGVLATFQTGTGRLRARARAPAGSQLSGFSPDGELLLTVADRTATVWEAATLRARATVRLPAGRLNLYDGPPYASIGLVTGGELVYAVDGVAYRWSVAGRPLGAPVELGDPEPRMQVVVDPRRPRIYGLAPVDGRLHRWDLDRREERRLPGWRAKAIGYAGLEIDPAGRVLAATVEHRRVAVSLPDGAPVTTWPATPSGQVIGWVEDSSRVVVASFNETVVRPDPARLPGAPYPLGRAVDRLPAGVRQVREDGREALVWRPAPGYSRLPVDAGRWLDELCRILTKGEASDARDPLHRSACPG